MSTDRELDTPSLTAVSEQNDSQRSSVITSAETNSVLLATMQEMLKCVADLTKKVDQRQHGPDDEPIDESLLDDEFNEGEPASKRPCLDASVSQMLSSVGTNASTDSAQVETVKLLRLRRPQVRFSTISHKSFKWRPPVPLVYLINSRLSPIIWRAKNCPTTPQLESISSMIVQKIVRRYLRSTSNPRSGIN